MDRTFDRVNNCGLAGAGKPGSRSRSICRQGRFTSRAAIIPRASPFRGWSAISGWRTRLRAGSSRFRVCRCSMPPDGRRNACNRVSSERPQRRSRHREARRVPGLAGRWKMGGKFILGPPSSRHPKSKRGFCAEGTRLTPMTPPAISRALRPLASPPGRSSSAG